MLLELRVANFRAFAEEQIFSFVADKDDTLPHNTIACAHSPTGKVIRLAVLYGPNGGGKSTLVRAVEVVRRLVVDSATRLQAGDPLPIEPFKLDGALRAAPSRFEVTFVADWHDPDDAAIVRPIRYQYGLTADRRRVREEWLIAYPHGQPQTWYEREPDGQGSAWHFGRHLKGEKARIAASTRPNALFLSVAAQQNQIQLLPAFSWFRQRLTTLGAESMDVGFATRPRFTPTSHETSQLLAEGGARRDAIVSLLREADLGIRDVRVERRQIEMPHPQAFSDEFLAQLAEAKAATFAVRTVHRDRDGTAIEWDLADESNGTQSLYCLLGPWVELMGAAGVGFIDDMFADLHPVLVQRLVRQLSADGDESANAQVLLTTHDTTLLDPKLLRRDQIWFVEKDRDGASHLYALLEYRPRKDESFQRGYLAGRYGALPFIGEVKF